MCDFIGYWYTSLYPQVKNLFNVLGSLREECTVLDALDRAAATVVEECAALIPQSDKTAALNAKSTLDFQWITGEKMTWVISRDQPKGVLFWFLQFQLLQELNRNVSAFQFLSVERGVSAERQPFCNKRGNSLSDRPHKMLFDSKYSFQTSFPWAVSVLEAPKELIWEK